MHNFCRVAALCPYHGIVIAAGFPLALAIAVDPGWTLLLLTISLFAVVELIVTNSVETWFSGSGAGLSPVALIVAGLLDLAMGADWPIVVHSADCLSGRARPACPPSCIPGCAPW
jgi:hypothetical protein